MKRRFASLPKLTKEEMTPPVIAVVPQGIKRPRWSVMIPTYNCTRFLRETLESVLSQDIDPKEMQIEVVDNCSTIDDPEGLVQEFGQGRVSFFRKQANDGPINNFNSCIARSIGEYIHILHSDDSVKPSFYSAIDDLIRIDRASHSLYFTGSDVINEDGSLNHQTAPLDQLIAGSNDPSFNYYYNKVLCPSCVVARSFYEKHGGFIAPLNHVADWELWARITALEGCRSLNNRLACYRQYNGNGTSKDKKSAANIRDYLKIAFLFDNLYPDFDYLASLRITSQLALKQVEDFRAIGDDEAAHSNTELVKLILNTLPDQNNAFVRIKTLLRRLVKQHFR